MSNFDPVQFAINAIQNADRSKMSPFQQNMLDILNSRDATRGEELARNICKSYGVSPDKAIEMAKQRLNIR